MLPIELDELKNEQIVEVKIFVPGMGWRWTMAKVIDPYDNHVTVEYNGCHQATVSPERIRRSKVVR